MIETTTDTASLRKILLAEDESHIREIAVLSLEIMGEYEVASCESGADVVEKALEFKPDLVILDVMMPGVDGPEAFEALRCTPGFESIPIVFMTAKALQAEVDELLDMGAAAVITKPFEPAELPQRLHEIWTQARVNVNEG